jgi:uncharacterized repeat protein (TIGR02543 family)
MFTFAGWYEDAALENEYDFDTPITQDITLYAKWTAKPSGGGGGGSPPPPTAPGGNTPPSESRKVIIVPGQDQDEQNIVEPEVTRKEENGKWIDEVTVNEEKVNEAINKATDNTD